MGTFFQNIHIRKTPAFSVEELRAFLTRQMEAAGYTPAKPKNCDLLVTMLAPEHSEWISVASDAFSFDSAQAVKDILLPYSKAFSTDVLGAMCMDSDLFFMNLVNAGDGTDGWFNAGRGPKYRHTALAPFRGKVTDYEGFRKALKSEWCFAEEPFQNAAPYLGMDMEQTLFNCDADGTFPEEIRLGFRLPQGQAPPVLTWHSSHGPTDTKFMVGFLNTGGKSRGLQIVFGSNPLRKPIDNWVESGEMTIEDAYLTIGWSNRSSEKRIPITLEKQIADNGQLVLAWTDPNFPIPAGVDPKLPYLRALRLEFEREIDIHYKIRGNLRKVLEVCVFINPLKNYPAGSSCWWEYRGYDTPKEYIEAWNKRREKGSLFWKDPADYDL